MGESTQDLYGMRDQIYNFIIWLIGEWYKIIIVIVYGSNCDVVSY